MVNISRTQFSLGKYHITCITNTIGVSHNQSSAIIGSCYITPDPCDVAACLCLILFIFLLTSSSMLSHYTAYNLCSLYNIFCIFQISFLCFLLTESNFNISLKYTECCPCVSQLTHDSYSLNGEDCQDVADASANFKYLFAIRYRNKPHALCSSILQFCS